MLVVTFSMMMLESVGFSWVLFSVWSGLELSSAILSRSFALYSTPVKEEKTVKPLCVSCLALTL